MKANQIHVMAYDPTWRTDTPENLTKIREAMWSMFGDTLKAMPGSTVQAACRPDEYQHNSLSMCVSGTLLIQEANVRSGVATNYFVAEDRIERRIARPERPSYAKVWQLYRDNSFRLQWKVTLNEHPRQPLHLKNGAFPLRGKQFIDELAAAIDPKALNNRVFEALCHAVHSWEIKDAFTKTDAEAIFGTLALLQHMLFGPTQRHTDDQNKQVVWDVTAKLDVLTRPGARSLTETFNIFLKEHAHDLA